MRICVVRYLISLGIFAALAGTPAIAGETVLTSATIADKTEGGPLSFDDQALDKLFAELRKTRDPDVARLIAARIGEKFRETESATLDMLMDHADKAAESSDFAAALDFIDQAVVLDPAFVEAWSRRASFHYLAGNRKKAMADIAQALKLEPRHINALQSMAGILEETGRKTQALTVWERYLELYPADRDAQKKAIDLSEEIAGQKT